MKIVVVGGTGRIGTRLVGRLRDHGHDPVVAAPRAGVDAVTGEGLPQVLDGAQVVVDVSRPSVPDDVARREFFRTSSANLRAAEPVAGVTHHVTLSVVGVDRLPDSGVLRAKAAQEEIVRTGSTPYTILRSTQFFEFVGHIADAAASGDRILLPPATVQPVAADDVAAGLARIAVGAPANDVIELAGPDRLRLDDLVRRVLRACGDGRTVVTDPGARYYGATLDDRSLVPRVDAWIGPTHLDDWLRSAFPHAR